MDAVLSRPTPVDEIWVMVSGDGAYASTARVASLL